MNGGKVKLDGARSGTFTDLDVDLKIFQRGIENFFYNGAQAVNLIDKQHVVRLKIGQHGGQIASPFEYRARGGTQIDAISVAMMCARVVLPKPGGPNSST